MNRRFLALTLIVVVAVFAAGAVLVFLLGMGGEVQALCKQVFSEQIVLMKEEGYEPKEINIKKCTKVTFRNAVGEPRWPASDIHPTHGIYPEFDPKQPVEVGADWSFVFDRIGRWKYHDHKKPLIRGIIEVAD